VRSNAAPQLSRRFDHHRDLGAGEFAADRHQPAIRGDQHSPGIDVDPLQQPGDAALAPWDQLLPALQRSNLSQAGDIPNKLATIGKRLARQGAPLRLDDEQIELLAEIEHGRWNVERLRGGWQLGEREVTRLVSSYLKPWAELDDEAREFDREAVRNLAPALAEAGWGVEDRS